MYKMNYTPQSSVINSSYARLVQHLKINHYNLPCKQSIDTGKFDKIPSPLIIKTLRKVRIEVTSSM